MSTHLVTSSFAQFLFFSGAAGFLVLLQRLKIERIGRVFQASKNAACSSVLSSLTFLKKKRKKNWHRNFRRKSGLSHKFMQCFLELHARAAPLQSFLSPQFALDHFSQPQPFCLKASAQQDKCSSILECDFSACPGLYFIWGTFEVIAGLLNKPSRAAFFLESLPGLPIS